MLSIFLSINDIRSASAASSQAFIRWFGESVVTETGLAGAPPKMVYHGTIVQPDSARVKNMGNIFVFDRLFTTQFRRPSVDTMGCWFSTNPSRDGAGMYAGENSGSVIYPVYLSICNPQVTTFDLMLRRARKLHNGVDDGRMIGQNEVNAYRYWLQETGRDGLRIRHDDCAPNGSTEFQHQDAWVALSPEQIKSAIGNRGMFDPNDPNICH